MLNLYTAIADSASFNKIEVNELLFVEYTCMTEETRFGIWSNNNYFAFITSGKKIWRTITHSYELDKNDIIFVKKGANLTHSFFDDAFCAVFIFIPDDYIKEFLTRNSSLLQPTQKNTDSQDSVLQIIRDQLLDSYIHSINSYLSLPDKPSEQLMKLKFDELLLSLFSNKEHEHLTDYFISLCHETGTRLNVVMENNYAYNLNLENYAQLCHMSLSTFKKAFKQFYGTTPAAWLKDKKLDLACRHIVGSALNIHQVSFECGFEDPSHFIRVFKQKYHFTPLQYRQKHSRLINNNVQTIRSVYAAH